MTLPEKQDCTFQCLTHCPAPDGLCYYDDPLIGWDIRAEYPEFFWWRVDNLPDNKRPLVLTPDSMDEFYKEPDSEGCVHRCPRCLSVDVDWQSEWIVCRCCDWSEPLHDYPVARRY